MSRIACALTVISLIACGPVALAQSTQATNSGGPLLLREGWMIQSSAEVSAPPELVSTRAYTPSGWYKATVPSTVIAGLVRQRVFADPYVGKDLRTIPGTTYAVGSNFSNIPMPLGSPFRVPWWFRTEFQVPQQYAGKTVWLHFSGINYRASVWLNGQQIAAPDKMVGAWRVFEFDVTRLLTPGQTATLAVEVSPPQPDDLAITFVDWNPLPADKDMGIWREVYLTPSGPVTLRYPQVISKLDLPALDKAQLTVTADLHNATDQPVDGTLTGKIEGREFSAPVSLAPKESKLVSFSPDQFPQLRFDHPRLWWPYALGPQNLYQLDLSFQTGGTVSDAQTLTFGIREISADLDAHDHRLFKINGKTILIRGAGWTFDMLLRADPARQKAELNYVKDMHLNTVRLEGKLEDENFLDVCDREGILVLAGWCCCDHWERWQNWKDEDFLVSAESLKDQIRRLRSHACLLDWLNGSDNPPVEKVERTYIQILKDCHWPNPYQSSATAKPTSLTGKTGLKMTGPYEYVAPSYWLLDRERGGAHGFNTETSPGPAVPPVESLQRMLPYDHLWPIDSAWDYHAGGGAFRDLHVFTEALNNRFGQATSLEDYAMKAQVLAYEGERAMFEAYGRNKYTSTGVIQWMLNNAWPSMIWHLYDYYLRPGGSYFGAKKGCEYLHVQYSYDDQSIVVVNSYYQAFPEMKVFARVYNLDMSLKFSQEATLNVGPDSTNKAFTLPPIADLSRTYFLRLDLNEASGKNVSSNFYWLSTQPDVLDWDRSTWYYTPTKTFADLTALQGLPKVDLKATAESEMNGEEGVTRVTMENPSHDLAFFVHFKVVVQGGHYVYEEEGGRPDDEVLPILWSDNYVSLLPGEKRLLTATYAKRRLRSGKPVVKVEGWNVVPKSP
jgi:exo-1,4-beta-D-glucosaminidase